MYMYIYNDMYMICICNMIHRSSTRLSFFSARFPSALGRRICPGRLWCRATLCISRAGGGKNRKSQTLGLCWKPWLFFRPCVFCGSGVSRYIYFLFIYLFMYLFIYLFIMILKSRNNLVNDVQICTVGMVL